MFITLSTIFAPIITGLILSLALEYPRLTAGTELPLVYIGALPLDGEQDCLLGLPPVGAGSTELERGLGAPGLPLVAESGLSGNVVLRFGGVSNEKPGMSDGFHGLDLTVGDAARDKVGFLLGVGKGFAGAEEEALIWDTVGFVVLVAVLPEAIGRRVGVPDLDMVLEGGSVGLEVGVEDLDRGVVDLEGPADFVAVLGVDLVAEPADLAVEVVGLDILGVSFDDEFDLLIDVALVVADTVDLELVIEGRVVEETVGREVGVEGLEGLEFVVSVDDLPVGVAGLDPGPPDDEGLRVVPLEELSPGEEVVCLDVKWFLAVGSVE